MRRSVAVAAMLAAVALPGAGKTKVKPRGRSDAPDQTLALGSLADAIEELLADVVGDRTWNRRLR
jgi:hypothetical protein